ncbi:ABC transporter substrate-binding protein [Tissierella praeacuta]|uniref:ABC transporter substrate-binding protein n=1 Tax=Tissierella praeacuta TaxID=43131 RepID=UPI0028AEEAB8|nr:ABC transporter substrate-binding protein [Tissierella praeacuta]
MKVYWNNICLISRFEKTYIEEKLKECNLEKEFQFEFFGLGKETELFTKIQRDIKNDSLPDVIISTDFEIFRNKEGLLNKQDLLQDYKPWGFREELVHVSYQEKFQPMLYIPMVMIANKERVDNIPRSIREILEDDTYEGQISFGGMLNSAGKILLATVEYLYGREKSEKLLHWSNTTSMPIGAFKNVVDGKSKIGFVPTIFAMRDGIDKIEIIWPKEGAIVIPSFVIIKKEANKDKLYQLFNRIINTEFIEQISRQTGVIPCIKDTHTIRKFQKYEKQIVYPSWQFIREQQEKGRDQ